MVTSSPTIAVPTRGLTWVDLLRLTLFLPLLVIVGLGAWSAFASRGIESQAVATAIGLGWLLGLYTLVVSRSSVRAVSVGPSGVNFSFPFREEYVPWEDLRPSRRPLHHSLWGVLRVVNPGEDKRRFRPYVLTLEQSQAVLAHPARPRWDIPEAVARSLGAPHESQSPPATAP